jgi:NADPH:quinone reductase-like Zn-dependent oxidoreductase
MIIVNGWHQLPVPPGRVQLSDVAGEMAAIGAGVIRFKVGDRVVNSSFPKRFGGSLNAMPE